MKPGGGAWQGAIAAQRSEFAMKKTKSRWRRVRRRNFAKLLGVKVGELDNLIRVTVQDGKRECDVNVQSELQRRGISRRTR